MDASGLPLTSLAKTTIHTPPSIFSICFILSHSLGSTCSRKSLPICRTGGFFFYLLGGRGSKIKRIFWPRAVCGFAG